MKHIRIVAIAFSLLVNDFASSQQQTEPENGAAVLTVMKDGKGSGVIVSAPPGIECGDGGNSCSASFAVGTPVALTAQAIGGDSVFEGWSDPNGSTTSCEAKSDCSFIMSEDSSIKGNFASLVSGSNQIQQ